MWEILQQMQNIGGDFIPLAWEDLYGLSQESIAEGLQTAYGGQEQDPWGAGMFSALTPEMLRSVEHKTYSPMIESGVSPLVTDLSLGMSGKKAKSAAGLGFAGTGAWKGYQQDIKDEFGRKASDVLKQAGHMKSMGRESIENILAQWRETSAGMMGPGQV
jgi:hypothetical protein